MFSQKIRRIVIAVVACCSLMAVGAGSTTTKPREIEIAAKRYSFNPSEVTLKKGEPVTLVFQTDDVTHGFILPELKLKGEIHKNHPLKITVQPDTVGTFEARCSYFCGSGHGGMRLAFHVVE
jgi:cytochrome c oxidase subunit II